MIKLIITCNAGSSNTKLAVFEARSLKQIENLQTHNEVETIAWLSSFACHPALVAGSGATTTDEDYISRPRNKCWVTEKIKIAAVGHRVVHGGDKFTKPALITPEVIKELEEFIPLAPLHQPAALELITETIKLYPDVPQIACFDTAFHHTISTLEKHFALPQEYYDSGIKRYGFHGLSYEYIASVLPKHLGDKANGRVIVAHLGNGSSMCALKNLKSVATTMGFSTLDGLMMGTRCGTLDVGVILHLLEHKNMSLDEMNKLLYKNSGLLGVSGVSSDMRELLASDKQEAKFAVELYCYLAAKQLAALLPAIGGIDALVFTGGIGEHAAPVRDKICNHLKWLGNFPVYVIPTDEELMIVRACRKLLGT